MYLMQPRGNDGVHSLEAFTGTALSAPKKKYYIQIWVALSHGDLLAADLWTMQPVTRVNGGTIGCTAPAQARSRAKRMWSSAAVKRADDIKTVHRFPLNVPKHRPTLYRTLPLPEPRITLLPFFSDMYHGSSIAPRQYAGLYLLTILLLSTERS